MATNNLQRMFGSLTVQQHSDSKGPDEGGGQTQKSQQQAPAEKAANGVKVLQEGSSPSVDIVAIHGLNGHREKTWTSPNGVLWLRDILPQILPNARIMTWGYDSTTHGANPISTQYLHDHADTLISNLTLKRELTSTQQRPIIFIAHSLGGLVLKSALVHSAAAKAGAQESNKAVYLSTYGIIFAGTPHQGGEGVSLAQQLMKVASIFTQTNDRMLQHLRRDSEEVQRLMRDFAPISGDFYTKCAYETLPEKLPTGGLMMIVPKASAAIPALANVESIAIHKSHSNMVKFEDEEDEDYKTLSGHLFLMARTAQKTIENRWKGNDPSQPISQQQAFLAQASKWQALDPAARKEELIKMGGAWRRSTQVWTKLHSLAQQNDVSGITAYLADNQDVNVRDRNDSTALNVAASLGNTNAVRVLLESGADPDIQDDKGLTPLSKAAERGAEEIVDLLLDREANLELTNLKANVTPIIKAAIKGRANIVKKLLAKGANASARGEKGHTALMGSMLVVKNRDLANTILDYRPDVTATDNSTGRTVLHWAAEAGFDDVCARILDLGAAVDATSADGSTPLKIAMVKADIRVIDVLRSRGASLHIKGNDGKSPNDIVRDVARGLAGTVQFRRQLMAVLSKYNDV